MGRCVYPFGVFPFPVPHVSSPPPDRVGVPLEVAMDWYWRVLRWRIGFQGTATANYAYTASDGSHAMGVLSLYGHATDISGRRVGQYYNYSNGFTADNESILPVPFVLDSVSATGPTGSGFLGGTPPPYDPAAVTGTVVQFLFGRNLGYRDGAYPPQAISGISYCEATGLFYPAFSLVASVGTTYGSGINMDGSYPPVPPNHPLDYVAPPHAHCDLVITIAGYSVTIEDGAYVEFGDQTSSGTLSGMSATFLMEPDEWWSYEGSDGVALYRGIDGSPATNPATGLPFTVDEIVAERFP